MASGRNDILATSELFEAILLQLDLRTLLVSAQRVSRHWHATIASSPNLQRALFFAPTKTPVRNADGDAEPQLNPLLAELFAPHFTNTASFPDGLALCKSPPINAAFLREPTASWRRMLVRQPPVYRLGEWNMNASRGKMWFALQVRTFEGAGGLRMGALYNMAGRRAPWRIMWDPQETDFGPERERYTMSENDVMRVVEAFERNQVQVVVRHYIFHTFQTGADRSNAKRKRERRQDPKAIILDDPFWCDAEDAYGADRDGDRLEIEEWDWEGL